MLLTQALQAIFFASHPQQRSISKIKQMLVTLNCLLSNHALIKVFIYIIFYAACIFFIILYFCHQKRFYCHLSFISILLFSRVLHHGFNCCMNAKMQMNGNCLSTCWIRGGSDLQNQRQNNSYLEGNGCFSEECIGCKSLNV